MTTVKFVVSVTIYEYILKTVSCQKVLTLKVKVNLKLRINHATYAIRLKIFESATVIFPLRILKHTKPNDFHIHTHTHRRRRTYTAISDRDVC